MIECDGKYMRRALQLARLGRGFVSPNPMVGAVIVSRGKIIGEGFHRHIGQGHAEVNAVASVADKSLLKDATMYVTLEPCSHYGKTPPCARLVIDMGIPRVVVGTLDPFAKVSGRGVKMLRDAGVEVVTGVLEEECRALNAVFMTAHTLHRPFVLLKWAQSSDGFMDVLRNERGSQRVISNQLTSMWTHRERACVDAIVVGARTVALDNPSLSVRNWNGRNPLRVVLDANLSIPADSRLINDGLPTLIYNRLRNDNVGEVEYVKTDTSEPADWLSDLYRRGVTSVMVEGGAQILSQMTDSRLWDEARVEIGAKPFLNGVKAPIIKEFITKVEHHDGNTIICAAQKVKKVIKAIE